jgi:hypothetical protein
MPAHRGVIRGYDVESKDVFLIENSKSGVAVWYVITVI